MSTDLPSNFRALIVDFTNDLTTTFPEYSHVWSKWTDEETTDEDFKTLYKYCMKVYPERFFDILYKNYDIFKEDSGINVYFLPNITFRLLFNEEGLSENSKNIMWNYLQLVLFTVVGDVKDTASFGEAMNMFEGIDSTVLQDKMKDVMENIGKVFENMSTPAEASSDEKVSATETPTDGPNLKEEFKNMFDKMPNMDEFAKKFPFSKMAGMPDLSKIQEHLQALFAGKIGRLAQELAEEVSGEFKHLLGGTENMSNPQEVIKELMKNPAKISKLMKTVSTRLDEKMKSGEISREEIMKEASEMMSKMNAEGGGEGLAEMFKTMAKNMGMGKNMRMDTNALDRMTKMSATKEKVRQNAERKKQQQAEQQAEQLRQYKERVAQQEQLKAKYSLSSAGGENHFVFKLDSEEAQEKSFIHPDLLKEIEKEEQAASQKKTKKAGKGKKK